MNPFTISFAVIVLYTLLLIGTFAANIYLTLSREGSVITRINRRTLDILVNPWTVVLVAVVLHIILLFWR